MTPSDAVAVAQIDIFVVPTGRDESTMDTAHAHSRRAAKRKEVVVVAMAN
jgi:hypothetical protein